MGIFNPPQLSRSDIQQPAYDRPEDEFDVVEKLLKKRNPQSTWDAATERARAQEAQADKLRSQSQGAMPPEEHTLDNSDLFDPAAPHMQRLKQDNLKLGERYPQPDAQGVSEQDSRVQAAGMSPANITPGATAIGKGGVIQDADMHAQNAGSRLNVPGAGMTTRKVSGRPEFYRARFYGR